MLQSFSVDNEPRPLQRAKTGHIAALLAERRADTKERDASQVLLRGQNAIHPDRPVSAIMTPAVICFKAEDTIAHVTQVVLARGISGAPVVNASGQPVGMISKTDLLEAWHEQAKSAAEPQDAAERHMGAEAQASVVVGDIMVPYLLAVQHTSPISLAAALMAYEGVHRLLVLSENSEMVGIVTSLDMLRWLSQLSGFYTTRPASSPKGLSPAQGLDVQAR